MSYAAVSASLGWLAVLAGVVGTYAQFRRVSTLGVAGVSLATWSLFALMGCFWISYGFAAHSAQVTAGSLIILPMQAAIVYRLRPWERWGVLVRALGAFVACCVVPTVLLGWAGGVYGTGVAMTINRLPQLLELVRHPDASGVSAGTWYLGVAGALCWVLYYTGAHLWAALVSTAVAGLANLVIALLTSWRHAQGPRPWAVDEAYAV
ncbi:MAG: hypothetical protein ACHQFZ_02880 [Acidimicrobiales bacterium]